MQRQCLKPIEEDGKLLGGLVFCHGSILKLLLLLLFLSLNILQEPWHKQVELPQTRQVGNSLDDTPHSAIVPIHQKGVF